MLKRFITFGGRLGKLAFGCLVAALAMVPTASATVPAVVVSAESRYAQGGMSAPYKVVVDGLGDVFTLDYQNGTLFVVAPGSTTPKAIVTGLGYHAEGLAVDSSNDLIVTNFYGYNVYFYTASSIAAAIAGGSIGTPNDLAYAYNFRASSNYYGNILDATFDNNGVAYVGVTYYPSGSTAYEILSVKTQGPATTVAGEDNTPGTTNTVVKNLPYPPNSMAADSSGHLFYADGYNVYEINTTTNASTTIGSKFTSPTGVSVDAAGNLYVSDNGKGVLFEIPNENGTLNPADQFAVAEPPNAYLGVGFDQQGNFYSADGYQSGSIDKTTLGGANFGSQAVGVASAYLNVIFTYNSAVSPISVALTPGSTEFNESYSTCSTTSPTSFPANCLFALNFKPASTGVRKGAIEFLSATGKALVTAYLAGTGAGPALTIDPGTQSSLSALTPWQTPSAVALDGQSNLYVADSKANAVQVISAAGVATATIGSGLSGPKGVAVDGAGNVIISDTGNNQIVEVPNENGTLNTADQVVLLSSSTAVQGTKLKTPLGVAVDKFGTIFVADSGNSRVLRLSTVDGVSAITAATVGSGYTTPTGLATDPNGNLFITDSTANQIYEVNFSTGSQTTALSNLNAPTAISIDASGSAYVVNSGTATVLRIPNVSGSLNANTQIALGTLSVLNTPSGVAVNGSGNVAITDSGVPGLYTLVRTSGTLPFGSVDTTQSSISETLTLTNAGNASLTLGSSPYSSVGAVASYAVTSATINGCTNSIALPTGGTCGYAAVFSPTTVGPLTDTLTFSTNAVNAASFTAALTGTGTSLPKTTTALSLNPAAPYYGEPVNVIATITPTNGNVPTGTVTFYVDGIPQKPLALSAAAPYTATYTFPALSLTASTHAMDASYSGDANNASSDAPVLPLVIAREPSTTTATVLPAVAQVPGSPFTFTAVVTPSAQGTPGGTLNLVAAGTTSPILVSMPVGSIQPIPHGPFVKGAVLSYTPTGGIGTYQYQVLYSGDVNFLPSTSNTDNVYVALEGYTVTLPSTSYTVTAGQSIVIPITVTGISGYFGNITMGAQTLFPPSTTAPCSGLPTYVTCTFSPGIVNLATSPGAYSTFNPTAVINMTITTSVPPPTTAGGYVLWPGAIAGILALALARVKRRTLLRTRLMSVLLCVVLGSLTLGAVGCGNSGGSTQYTTPKGTNNITLTVSGSPIGYATTTPPPGTSNIVNTTTFSLTVQ